MSRLAPRGKFLEAGGQAGGACRRAGPCTSAALTVSWPGS